jgi:hypothetical protein
MVAELRRWRPSSADLDGGRVQQDGGKAQLMAAECRRWRSSPADGGRVPQVAAKLSRWRPAQPRQCEIKSNLIKLLKEKCGEEMKSGTNSRKAGPAPAGHNDGGGKHGQKFERTAEKAHKSNAECFLRHFRSVQ